MGPTSSLGYLIQHLSAVMGKQFDHVLEEQLGIGISQYRVLMVLEWSPRVQQRTIAETLGQTEASISRQVKILEERGLVVAKPDQQNARNRITVPTPLGMQITEAATALMRRSFGPEYAKLGDEQLNILLHGLQQLHQVICQAGRAGACDHQLGL